MYIHVCVDTHCFEDVQDALSDLEVGEGVVGEGAHPLLEGDTSQMFSL